MMSLDTLLEHLDAGQPLVTGTEAFDCMHGYSYEAMRLTAELNNAFHTPEEIREIMGRITGRPIDETFRPTSRSQASSGSFRCTTSSGTSSRCGIWPSPAPRPGR